MKILLDTNIISELMKSTPDQNVTAWLDQQNVLTLYITSVSVAEIYYGLNLLPAGKKGSSLEMAFNNVIETIFSQRVLAFNTVAASHYGVIMAEREKLGRRMSALDGQIAAIAKMSNALLATRNIKDFVQTGIEVFNPFTMAK